MAKFRDGRCNTEVKPVKPVKHDPESTGNKLKYNSAQGYGLHFYSGLEVIQIRHNLTMNCLYLTLLVFITIFSEAKGFCGKTLLDLI